MPRDGAVHDVKEDEADREARERREETDADPHETAQAGADESVGDGRGSEGEAKRNDRERGEYGHERGRLEMAPHEGAPTLPAEDGRERAIERAMDRHRREDRAHDADREGEGTSLHELVGDAGLLRGRRGIDVAKDFDQIALGAIRAVDEREDANEEREQWDEREEDLVRDRTGEEGAIVVREALNERSAARNRAG